MFEEKPYEIYHGDCLEIMKTIDDKSIDMIFCDLPYGTTNCRWDSIIPLNLLWEQYNRIIKVNGCIALWGQAPFSHVLAYSNLKKYRYEWIIEKTKATGHLNAKRMPMKAQENILLFGDFEDSAETVQVFYNKLPTYNPQKTEGHTPVHSYTKHTTDGECYNLTKIGVSGGGSTQRYPRNVLKFAWDTQKLALHPTQKPIECCDYFIKTYTNENMIILDNCMGSGTTGESCVRNKRKFIGIEKEDYYFNIASNRIENTYNKLNNK